jgi:hypothetical protein
VPYAYRAQVANSLDASANVSGGQVGSGIDASKITTGTLSLNGSDALKLPSGTTAQRPASPVAGLLRYNTTENVLEYFNGTNWYFTTPKVAIVKDSRSSGTPGGPAMSANAWFTRTLGTIEGDNSVVSLSSNQMTLAPGEYIVEASAVALAVNENKIRIYNITTSTTEAVGLSAFSFATYNVQNNSILVAKITIPTSPNIFELQHLVWTASTTVNALGVCVPASVPEIYAQVKITKLR